MAEQLWFARHTKVYLKQGANVWEIPVMDGFSFSQATNATEVILAEMESTAGVSRRGRTTFNDSYAPAEWSFQTYARPFHALAATGEWEDTAVNVNHSVEEALWANFIAAYDSTNTWTPPAVSASVWPPVNTFSPITYGSDSTGTVIDFTASNRSLVGTFELWFELGHCSGDTVQNAYKISECAINSCTMDFDIDGLAMFSWSGFGAVISDEGDPGTTLSDVAITEGTDATTNFIRNRLTTLACTAADAATFPGAGAGVYNMVLTGGSISFENNITYLTPETLCTVNQPLGHVTGTRTIGGSFTAYLDTGDAGASGDLWDDLIAATDKVTNSFDLTFTVGGAAVPSIAFQFPQAHMEVPSHGIEDVISLEMTFSALPSTISETDEATITYTGTTLA